MEWVKLASYYDLVQAELIKGLLQAEGVDARLDNTGQYMITHAMVEIVLSVPATQRYRAEQVLLAQQRGDYADEDESSD